MKTKIFTFLLLIMIVHSCSNTRNISELLNFEDMKPIDYDIDTIDVEIYNLNKDKFGLYKRIEEGIIIEQNKNDNKKYYFEIRRNGIYSEYKTYYLSGKLRTRGKLYNEYTLNIGIWEYYDEEGNLTRTEDYDSKDAINWKRALEIVYQKYGYKPEDITLSDNNSYWMIQCTSGKHIGKGVDVDKKTGKTIAYTIQYTL